MPGLINGGGITVSGGGPPLPTGTLIESLVTGAIAESMSRMVPGTQQAPTSGTLRVSGMYIPGGKTISSISFVSGGTALATGSNQWFVLCDSSRNRLAITGDDTSTAWASNAIKTLNLTASYTTTYSGLHYVGVLIVASTVPTLIGANPFSNVTTAGAGFTPALTGNSDASLTNPASCPSTIAAPSGSVTMPYCCVS